MTAGSKLSFPCGTRGWKQKMLVSSAVPRRALRARGARPGRSPTIEALFVPGDRKNSDLRVSVHFLFLSFFRRFFSVSSFDYAGRKSKLFWKHYLLGFRRLRIDIKISLLLRLWIKKKKYSNCSLDKRIFFALKLLKISSFVIMFKENIFYTILLSMSHFVLDSLKMFIKILCGHKVQVLPET